MIWVECVALDVAVGAKIGRYWGWALAHPRGATLYIIFISFIMPPQPSHFIIISFMDIGHIFIS